MRRGYGCEVAHHGRRTVKWHTNIGRLQIIWRRSWSWRWLGPWPTTAKIYSWCVHIGPLEIRWFAP